MEQVHDMKSCIEAKSLKPPGLDNGAVGGPVCAAPQGEATQKFGEAAPRGLTSSHAWRGEAAGKGLDGRSRDCCWSRMMLTTANVTNSQMERLGKEGRGIACRSQGLTGEQSVTWRMRSGAVERPTPTAIHPSVKQRPLDKWTVKQRQRAPGGHMLRNHLT